MQPRPSRRRRLPCHTANAFFDVDDAQGSEHNGIDSAGVAEQSWKRSTLGDANNYVVDDDVENKLSMMMSTTMTTITEMVTLTGTRLMPNMLPMLPKTTSKTQRDHPNTSKCMTRATVRWAPTAKKARSPLTPPNIYRTLATEALTPTSTETRPVRLDDVADATKRLIRRNTMKCYATTMATFRRKSIPRPTRPPNRFIHRHIAHPPNLSVLENACLHRGPMKMYRRDQSTLFTTQLHTDSTTTRNVLHRRDMPPRDAAA